MATAILEASLAFVMARSGSGTPRVGEDVPAALGDGVVLLAGSPCLHDFPFFIRDLIEPWPSGVRPSAHRVFGHPPDLAHCRGAQVEALAERRPFDLAQSEAGDLAGLPPIRVDDRQTIAALRFHVRLDEDRQSFVDDLALGQLEVACSMRSCSRRISGRVISRRMRGPHF
jgi:hypothetical protein